MDSKQRLELDKLIKEYNSEDTTLKIRELKHSSKIKDDIKTMENLKTQYSRLRNSNTQQFRSICEKRCLFLYNHYTNIFNRIFKDELNLEIMDKFINILEQIENNKIDQHEASYKVGTILKELYIDSALKTDKKHKTKRKKTTKSLYNKSMREITWNQYKMMK